MAHNVLIIAHRFPPIASSGSFRPAKFVKYLPEFGWQPYVITTDRVAGEGMDPTLLQNVPEKVKVWRIPTPEPHPVARLQKWFRWKPSSAHIGTPAALSKTSIQPPSTGKANLWRILRRTLLTPLFWVQYPPIDTELYWVLRIVPYALRIIQKEQIDVIFTTSYPWSSLLAGLILQKLTRRPWVADLRDPWTTDKARYEEGGWRRAIDLKIEKTCLQHADAVITVHPDWLIDLQKQANSEHAPNRFHLITNGYDSDDFPLAPLPTLPQNNTVKCRFLGSIYRGWLEPLLSAMECLEPSIRAKLSFEFIGYIHPVDLARLECSPVRKHFIHQPERTTHVQALELMRNAHMLLLPMSFECYPGKLFEYMRIGRPILGIVPPGLASELILRSGTGCTVNRDDMREIVNILRKIATNYKGFVEQVYRPNQEMINQFDRRALTGRLALVFEELATTQQRIQHT